MSSSSSFSFSLVYLVAKQRFLSPFLLRSLFRDLSSLHNFFFFTFSFKSVRFVSSFAYGGQGFLEKTACARESSQRNGYADGKEDVMLKVASQTNSYA